MIATLMIQALLVGGILTLAGWALEVLLKGRGYPLRWGWIGIITGTALLPLAMVILPSAPSQDPMGVSSAIGIAPASAIDRGVISQDEEGSILSALVGNTLVLWKSGMERLSNLTSSAAIFIEQPLFGGTGLGLLWGSLTLLTLLLFLLSAWRLYKKTAPLPRKMIEGQEIAVAEILGPAVVGFVHPKIVLPRWLLSTSTEALSMVIAHEEEHLRARDTLLLAGGLGAIVLFPWNPFLWIQLRRLRLSIELDCDARVVRRGFSPTRYASTLLDVGSRSTALPLSAAALAEPPFLLELRMRTLCTPFRKISSLRASLVGAATLLLLAVACDAPTPVDRSAGPSLSEAVGDADPSLAATVISSGGLSDPDGTTGQRVCMQGANGEMECTEVSGDPDSHVVCAANTSGRWECTEVNDAQAAQQSCVTVSGTMYLCADSISYDQISRQADDTTRGEAPANSPSPSSSGAPQGTPQQPTFTPYEVNPEVRNIAAIQAAIVREYPRTLRDQRIGGTVVMYMFISETGVVEHCQVETTSGYALLDDAGLRVCPLFEFVPARNGGDRVPVWVQIPISFTAR